MDNLIEKIKQTEIPLNPSRNISYLLDMVDDARYVLLGEASHGTHEFYTWRTEITQQLIEKKGFSFIAVEGDWPDCYRINRFINDEFSGKEALEVLSEFERWPTWMWANYEVLELVKWLHRYNKAHKQQVNFYGLDVYSLWESLDEIMHYIQDDHPDLITSAKQAFSCFEPYGRDEQAYARATALVPTSCEQEVVSLLVDLRKKAIKKAEGSEFFNVRQNAWVVKNAEKYYRTMVRGGSESWNVRDRHMYVTLERLMEHHEEDAKCIVWEHNTHIGDARATDMARDGMINIGQLVRENHEQDDVALIGFSTYEGSVIAADEWGAPMEKMDVPAARKDSWEDAFHQSGAEDKLFIFNQLDSSEAFKQKKGQRAIGVVYHPEYETFGNYVPTVIGKRYDAVIHLDKTTALTPIYTQMDEEQFPQAFPSGL